MKGGSCLTLFHQEIRIRLRSHTQLSQTSGRQCGLSGRMAQSRGHRGRAGYPELQADTRLK